MTNCHRYCAATASVGAGAAVGAATAGAGAAVGFRHVLRAGHVGGALRVFLPHPTPARLVCRALPRHRAFARTASWRSPRPRMALYVTSTAMP